MKKVLFIFILLSLWACNTNEVIVKHEGGKTRIQAINENILRVSSVPEGGKFVDGKSLMTVPVKSDVKLEITRRSDCYLVSAGGISAEVRLSDGAVIFYGADGQMLTSEAKRNFTPVEFDGDKGYSVQQTFNSPEDEAFYGLGQHQADEWNYKGRNEELYQYNTKIAVPFVVSSKRYGLLWDSNSLVRWGDSREYSQINEVFELLDVNGREGALTGTYTAANGEKLVRRETAINQEYLITPECVKVGNAPDFDFQGSKVVFEGILVPHETGLFNFYLYYAGYTKVYLGGELIVPEIWRTAWNPNGRKFSVEMVENEAIPLRIEWEPDGGVSYCSLKVHSPLPSIEQNNMSWWGELQDQIDYYIVAGEDIDGVISGYRTLTGKSPIVPKWAMGYWQSFERYKSQNEVVSTLSELRSRHIGVDNIVQDWQYWKDDQWGSHEFDESRYPNPKAMVDYIHDNGARFMISVWPKFYKGTEHFDEMDSKGWIYRTAIDEKVIDWLGYEQSFYDAYSPEARKLFWQQMEDHLFGYGVDAWWMDASEPNIHDCTDMDYRKKMQGPTALGSSSRYLNAYSLMNAEAIYNGQRSVAPNQRVFLLTRNGFAGLQRYSTASWSGDIGTRWEDMKAQISAGLNYSISGIPIWGQDVGGFSVENRYVGAQNIYNDMGIVTYDLLEWRELNSRWHQWGIFTPLYRAHGQFPNREPYNIAPEGSETYNIILAANKLRYKLMPYIYTMAARVHFDDYTMMRPLVMDFTDDATALDISDQFMFGDALMICPVYEYKARSRSVYLPEGIWYDFWSNDRSGAGTWFEAAAPIDRIPVFARGGQIIAFGPEIEYTAQDKGEWVQFVVYAGADAQYSLYEDEGVNYNYENGAYSWIPVSWDDASRRLTIGSRIGSFEGMAAVKAISVKVVSRDGIAETWFDYNGEEKIVEL